MLRSQVPVGATVRRCSLAAFQMFSATAIMCAAIWGNAWCPCCDVCSKQCLLVVAASFRGINESRGKFVPNEAQIPWSNNLGFQCRNRYNKFIILQRCLSLPSLVVRFLYSHS